MDLHVWHHASTSNQLPHDDNGLHRWESAAWGIGGNLSCRDLDAYYEAKKNENGLAGIEDPLRQSVKDMANRAAVAVAWRILIQHMRLATQGRTPLRRQFWQCRLSRTRKRRIWREYRRLCMQSEVQNINELRMLLQSGDVEQGKQHHLLTLKNFVSAGSQRVRYLADAEDAYERAYRLLTNCRQNFVLPAGALSLNLSTLFTLYFGNPNAMVTVARFSLEGRWCGCSKLWRSRSGVSPGCGARGSTKGL